MNHASPQGVTPVLGHLCKPNAFTRGAQTIWLQGAAHSLIGNARCAQACTQVHPSEAVGWFESLLMTHAPHQPSRIVEDTT